MKLLKIGLVLLATIALLGCGGGGGSDPCTHNFGGAWQKDATDHWKVCALCNETGQKAAHSFDGVKCTVCDYPDPSYTPCNCTHLLDFDETCNCGITGCNCQPHIYGTVAGIPIYKKGAVADMSAMVTALQTAYADDWFLGNKTDFVTKVDKIVIVPGGDEKAGLVYGVMTIGESSSNILMQMIGASLAEPPPTTREAGTVITLMKPDGVTSFGSATVKSSDAFTNSEWDTLVADVTTALQAKYDGGDMADKDMFERVFAAANNAEVILGKDFVYVWEVKDGEFNKMYIKSSYTGLVDYKTVSMWMDATYPWAEPQP